MEELTAQLNAYVVSNNLALTTSFRDVSDEMSAVKQRIAVLEDLIRDRGHGRGEEGGKGRSLIHPKSTLQYFLKPITGRSGRATLKSTASTYTTA